MEDKLKRERTLNSWLQSWQRGQMRADDSKELLRDGEAAKERQMKIGRRGHKVL